MSRLNQIIIEGEVAKGKVFDSERSMLEFDISQRNKDFAGNTRIDVFDVIPVTDDTFKNSKLLKIGDVVRIVGSLRTDRHGAYIAAEMAEFLR